MVTESCAGRPERSTKCNSLQGSRLVWTPDPSGHARKGLGNNFARKCLAGMPRFLNQIGQLEGLGSRLFSLVDGFAPFGSCIS